MAVEHYELQIAAQIDKLPSVIAFLDDILEKYECIMSVQVQLEVAIEEVYVNVAHYAYAPDTGEATITVDYENDTKTVTVTVIDSGIEFNPLAKVDPDITLSAEDREIGGLGIYMVKKSMDSVSYERKDGQNIFSMTKKIK